MTPTLRMLSVVVTAVLWAVPTHAVPFHACTFYDAEYEGASWDCAEPRVDPIGTCTITHCISTFCITYPGALWEGYTPEWFVEVTNRAKKSAFVAADTFWLQAQLDLAPWSEPSVAAWTSEQRRARSESSLYFGRVVPVPYGPLGWTWLLPEIFDVGTPVMPACFAAITEMLPELWKDEPDSPDRVLASLWSPLTAPGCTLGGGIQATLQLPSLDNGTTSLPNLPCAWPIPNSLQKVAAFASSTAWDPGKQCMGALGGLYPRTGVVDGDVWTAAQRVAWRTASVTADIFGSADVAVRAGDKWQEIWPRAISHRCFHPGSLLRPSTFDPTSLLVRPPAYDTVGTTKDTEFVFAVWRKRTSCIEPFLKIAAEAEIRLHPEIAKAICGAVNGWMHP